MGQRAARIAFAAITAVSGPVTADQAWAAPGAYAVAAAANPSCVANILKPVELSLLTNRWRSDGEWSTTIAPKAKWNIVPTGIGKFGFSFYAGGQFDAMTGENLSAFAVVPATYRLSETMRININAGWLCDRTV